MNNNSLTGSTILVVDDDLISCKLLEDFLKLEGYNPITANSGQTALDIVNSRKIDLILLDVLMPEMDGFEVCISLQENPLTQKIPVIFVTAKDDNESFIKGFKLGAIDYLNKPINRLELTVKIRNYITLSRNEARLRESELRYKNIFHSSVDGIVIINFDNVIIEANQSFQKIFDLTGRREAKAFFKDFIHYNDLKIYENSFNELIQSGPNNSPLEVKMVDSGGSVRVYEIISKVIEYQLGKSVLSILRDITERKEMHLNILNTIIDTEEKERKRFAQDLHDGLGPLLSTIKLYTKSVLTAKNQENKEIAIEKSILTIDEAIAGIKEIANNISPHILRNFGLVVAINSFINKFSETNKENINFQHDINKRLNPKIESALFRIIIELINNTFKHACANNININLNSIDGIIGLNYTDDGIGCDLKNVIEKQSGNGISNIINRTKSLNGEININTGINMGFYVQIRINDQ